MTVTVRRKVQGTKLTLAVPNDIAKYSPTSGAGKMWRMILAELRGMGVTVDFQEPRPRRRFGRRPDVWLCDGHAGALDVSGPVVAHLHEAPWFEPPHEHLLDPTFATMARARSEEAAQQAALIITGSEFSRRQIVGAHTLNESRVRVVPHGVDRVVFNPSRRSEGQRLVRSSGGALPYVCFVSTVHPRKNLDALRRAMILLAERGFDHHLVQVIARAPDRGDSEEIERSAMSDLPGWPGRVHSFRDLSEIEVAGLMAAATALCAPSLSEGFGFAALEAMASGTPVVASNRGALPEVIGEAGITVDPAPEQLADALQLILENEDQAMARSKAGLSRSRTFTWRASANGWKDALEEAMST